MFGLRFRIRVETTHTGQNFPPKPLNRWLGPGTWAGYGEENLPDPETRRIRSRGNENSKPGDNSRASSPVSADLLTRFSSGLGSAEERCLVAFLRSGESFAVHIIYTGQHPSFPRAPACNSSLSARRTRPTKTRFSRIRLTRREQDGRSRSLRGVCQGDDGNKQDNRTARGTSSSCHLPPKLPPRAASHEFFLLPRRSLSQWWG